MPNDDARTVECTLHGAQKPAFVCQHLNLVDRVGFIEGFDPDSPDEVSFHAWCSDCDAVLIEEGDWNDRSEAFAKPRLICRACYAAMKQLNMS
jgi:hypothetical protein